MQVLINITFLIIGFVLISLNQKKYNSYINHFTIFGFIWPFITIGTQIIYPESLKIEVVILFYICWLSYIIGSSIIKIKFSPTRNDKKPSKKNIFKLKILIYILVIFCFISNWELLMLISNIGNLLAWATLRKEDGFSDLDQNIFYTLFQRVYLIYIPLSIYLLKYKAISKKIVILLFLTGFLFSILKFTRAPILNLLIVTGITYIYIFNKKLPISSILVVGVIMLTIFISSTLLLADGSSNYDVFGEIKLYLFGGQVAYQDILEGKYIDNLFYDIHNYTFDFLNYIWKKLGLIESYLSYVRNYSTRYGNLTNIYTYLDAYTMDFGIYGAIIGSFLTGLLSDYSYKVYATKKNIFALIFYGYVCYYNCFIFANNEFIRFPVILLILSLLIYNLIFNKSFYAKYSIK